MMKMVTHDSVSEDLWRTDDANELDDFSLLCPNLISWLIGRRRTRAPRVAWCCRSCTRSRRGPRPGTGPASRCCPQRSRRWCRTEWRLGSGWSSSSRRETWPESEGHFRGQRTAEKQIHRRGTDNHSRVSPGWRRCRGGWWCRSKRCRRACHRAPPRWTEGCRTGSRSPPRPCTNSTGCPSSPGELHTGLMCWTWASAPHSAHGGERKGQRWASNSTLL